MLRSVGGVQVSDTRDDEADYYSWLPTKRKGAHSVITVNKIKTYQQQTRTTKQIFLVFITLNGLKQTIYSEEIVDGIVTLEDLFR